MKHFPLIMFLAAATAAAQTPTQVDWNTQIKNKPTSYNYYGLLVTQSNASPNNGGYVDSPPITYNPNNNVSPCYDWFGNAVTQPLPAAGQPAFGTNDVLWWNTTSGDAPNPTIITTPGLPAPVYPIPPKTSCGQVLNVNTVYGWYTNGLVFAMGGLGTSIPGFNSIQSYFGGVAAAGLYAAALYPAGTVTACCGTLASATYLGGTVTVGHSTADPQPICNSFGVCNGDIGNTINPLPAYFGVVQGEMYYNDNNDCLEVANKAYVFNCLATGTSGSFTGSVTANTSLTNTAGFYIGTTGVIQYSVGSPSVINIGNVYNVYANGDIVTSGTGHHVGSLGGYYIGTTLVIDGSENGTFNNVTVNGTCTGCGGGGGGGPNFSTSVTACYVGVSSPCATNNAGFYIGDVGIIQWATGGNINIGNVYNVYATGDIVTSGTSHHLGAGTGSTGGVYVGSCQIIDGSGDGAFVNLSFSGTGPYTAGSGVAITGNTISATGGGGGGSATAAAAAGSTNQVQFNAGSGALTFISIDAAGTSYAVNNIVTIVQGGASGGTAIVTSVSGGTVTGIALLALGTGYTTASGLATTGGAGTGLTITVNAVGGVFGGSSSLTWNGSTLGVTGAETVSGSVTSCYTGGACATNTAGFYVGSVGVIEWATGGTINIGNVYDVSATGDIVTTGTGHHLGAGTGSGGGLYVGSSQIIDGSGNFVGGGNGTFNALTVTSCSGCGAGGSAGGANTNIQFNNSGAFGGSANFTWSGTAVGVTGAVNASASISACTNQTASSACTTNTAGFYVGNVGVIEYSTATSSINIGNVFDITTTGDIVTAYTHHVDSGFYDVSGTTVIDSSRDGSFTNLSFSGTGPYTPGNGTITIVGTAIYGNYANGTGVTISGNTVSIGQAVATTNSPTFASLVTNGSIQACGTGACSTNYAGFYIGSTGIIEYSTANSGVNIGNVINITNSGYTSSTGGFVANGSVGVTGSTCTAWVLGICTHT